MSTQEKKQEKKKKKKKKTQKKKTEQTVVPTVPVGRSTVEEARAHAEAAAVLEQKKLYNNLGAMSPDILLSEAEQALIETRYDDAIRLTQFILSKDAKNVAALDILGQTYVESGNPQEAGKAIVQSIALAPDQNPDKYFTLAQLQQGADAVKSYERGIRLKLEEKKKLAAAAAAASSGGGAAEDMKDGETSDPQKEISAIDWSVSSAYCSLVEIYTTDLCDEDDAEAQCERLLKLAVTTCPTNPEVYQALSNLRLIQGRQEEAKNALLKCAKIMQDMIEAGEDDDHPLTYDLKCEVAKLAYELKLGEVAADFSDLALRENEENPEMCYLSGASLLLKGDEPDSALEALQKADEQIHHLAKKTKLDCKTFQSKASDAAVAKYLNLHKMVVEGIQAARAAVAAAATSMDASSSSSSSSMDVE